MDEQGKRMVGDTGYKIKYAISIGDREIVYAENINEEQGLIIYGC